MQVAAGLSDISAKLVDKVSLWIDTLVVMFPNLVVAVVVVTVGWGLGRLARRLVYGALERLHTPHSVNALVSWLASVAVLSGGLMIALGILHLEKAATSLLAGAGIVGLAVGFAFQDLLDPPSPPERLPRRAERAPRADQEGVRGERHRDPVPDPHPRFRHQGRCTPDGDGAPGADRRGSERQRTA
ncbi:hypothetical protein BE17_02505 [Sorangium cellulosum]|uniref:Uncharacterized protein n=1 Tax=Sorangium cellulosum TaxID=56 RepID=A0A150R3H0_SORCE|nr:hypothetical protein BE17_02505 [Sorangium cellulosum]